MKPDEPEATDYGAVQHRLAREDRRRDRRLFHRELVVLLILAAVLVARALWWV